MRSKLKWSIICGLLAVTMLYAWTGAPTAPLIHAQGQEQTVTRNNEPAPMAFPIVDPYAIADIAEEVTPAVVYVEATWPSRPSRSRNPILDDPFFRDFFFPFNPWPDNRPQVQRGTGFIIDQEGHVLTNHHVVGNPDGPQKVKVKIHTNDFQGELDAEILGADERLDLAVLKIDKPEQLPRLPVIRLGDSDASRPGEWVIAVGNPYGEQFEHTVTVGVLSAKGREIQIYDDREQVWKQYRNLMQTDAAINPGNSGGPLINIKGEVIGINTAVSASAQGIGFAIPINTAINVQSQLIDHGYVKRAFLGIGYEDLTQRDADLAGLDSAEGIVVVEVVPDSAAAEAGIQQWDIIVAINGRPITNSRDLLNMMEVLMPGDEMTIEAVRRGQPVTLKAVLKEAPTNDD